MADKREGGGYGIAGILYMLLGLVAGVITWIDSGSVVYGLAVVIGMGAVALPLIALAQVLETLAQLRVEVSRLKRDDHARRT